MKKKIIAIISSVFLAVLALFALVGCGDDGMSMIGYWIYEGETDLEDKYVEVVSSDDGKVLTLTWYSAKPNFNYDGGYNSAELLRVPNSNAHYSWNGLWIGSEGNEQHKNIAQLNQDEFCVCDVGSWEKADAFYVFTRTEMTLDEWKAAHNLT